MEQAETPPVSIADQEQRQAYVEAIKRAEEEAKVDPAGYRRKIMLFAMFGYFFLLVPLFLLVGVAVGLVWLEFTIGVLDGWGIYVAIVLCILAYGFLTSLWVRLPAPEGVKVRRIDAPGLYAIIDAIRAQAQLPKLSAVYLTVDANASLYTRPLILGLFGPGRQTLLLGVVLLAGADGEQLRAVLAHEFSHQRKGEASAATWGYRVRASWSHLAERGNILITPILKWFAPRLDAMTFVGAREAEYDADTFSVSMTNAQTAGDMLLRFTLVSSYFESVIVHEVHESIGRTAMPPSQFYRSAIARIRGGEADALGRQYFVRALRDQTGYEDTHPCLVDRLLGMGYHQAQTMTDPTSLVSPPQPTDDALVSLFDQGFVERALDRFDQTFVTVMAEPWLARHAMVVKSKAALGAAGTAGSDAVAVSDIDTCEDVEALVETAIMVIETRGVMDAMPWVERALVLDPGESRANAIIAKELLDADDASGIDYAERASERDPRQFWLIWQSLYAYFRGQGLMEQAEALLQRIGRLEEQLHQATHERTHLTSAKRIEPHDLSEMQVRQLQEDIARHPRVLRAHLFKMRKLKHLTEIPGYVLAIKFKRGQKSFTLSGESDFAKVGQEVSDLLRTHHWIIVYSPRQTSWLRRPCRKRREAEIYRRRKGQ